MWGNCLDTPPSSVAHLLIAADSQTQMEAHSWVRRQTQHSNAAAEFGGAPAETF
jgi:hypothetical protein